MPLRNLRFIKHFLTTALLIAGMHFNANAQHVALIPEPQQLEWKKGAMDIRGIHNILINDSLLLPLAQTLQKILSPQKIQISFTKPSSLKYVALALDPNNQPPKSQEAYSLSVNDNSITIHSKSLHGIFNGIQTLQQLLVQKPLIAQLQITDWPAFKWRGYMVDAARNFMSLNLLKQQIDIMAAYKLNIFHFHITEDIAWRLESKKYPELRAPKICFEMQATIIQLQTCKC